MAYPATSNISTGIGYLGSLPALASWGTDGIYSGTIITSISDNQMVEEVKIENGTGLTSWYGLLVDGEEVNITFEDDRSITWPQSGGTITIFAPRANGSTATSATFQVVHNNWNGARKQNGTRNILAKKFTLITPSVMS
jgi:hypothetical protein